MKKIYTIGFTKKNAEIFFELLRANEIDILLDVRLKNTSQLAGFSRYPDVEYFMNKILGAEYIHDTVFAPTDDIMKDYKDKKIDWSEFISRYDCLADERKTEKHILKEYKDKSKKNICLICSEEKADNCHRLLVAERFKKLFKMEIVNL